MIGKNETIERIAELLREAKKILLFTGAGVSVDAGIPDFRSPGGIWSRMDPQSLSTDSLYGSPREKMSFWETWRALYESCGNPQPDPTHLACAALERAGKVLGLLTQNIDGLHQTAGSCNVRELHGNMERCYCEDCDERISAQEVLKILKQTRKPPMCTCGGPLRPEVVVFGDPLDGCILTEADKWSRECDLCIVLGSSLTVYPAAQIPYQARQNGAKLLIVNRDPTQMDTLATFRTGLSLNDSFVPAVELLNL